MREVRWVPRAGSREPRLDGAFFGRFWTALDTQHITHLSSGGRPWYDSELAELKRGGAYEGRDLRGLGGVTDELFERALLGHCAGVAMAAVVMMAVVAVIAAAAAVMAAAVVVVVAAIRAHLARTLTVSVARDELLACEVREGVAPLEPRVGVRHVVELKAAQQRHDHVIRRHVRRRLAR